MGGSNRGRSAYRWECGSGDEATDGGTLLGSTRTSHARALAVHGDSELSADADLLAPAADVGGSAPGRDDMATQHLIAEEK